jgi:hypothetical protein
VGSAHVFLYLLDGKPVSSTLPGNHSPSLPSASSSSSKSAGQLKQRHQQSQQQQSGSGPLIRGRGAGAASSSQQGSDKEAAVAQRREADWQSTLATSAKLMESLYPEFTRQAERQGWKLSQVRAGQGETNQRAVHR